MTKAQLKAMKNGRTRYLREQRREAIKRVRAFEAWLTRGSVLREIPRELPSDADYRTAREAGATTR